MKFEYDLVICYSSGDDENGWVANFAKYLKLLLERNLEREIRVAVNVDGENNANISQGFSLIPVISPEFLANSNLKSTLTAMESAEGMVFTVVKEPVESEGDFKDKFAYEFFDHNPETDVAQPLESSKIESNEYWTSLVDLSKDIAKHISQLAQEKETTKVKSIYLAMTTPDQRKNWEIVRRELISHGHQVFPKKPISITGSGAEEKIAESIGKTELAIHFVGSNYGDENNIAANKIVDLQNTVAAEHSGRLEVERKEYPRFIWISPDIRFESEKQRLKIEQLKRDLKALRGAEIIQTPVEIFKTIIQTKIAELDRKGPEMSTHGEKNVYVIHDKTDTEHIVPLINLLKESGCHTLAPDYEGDNANLFYTHWRNLVSCDAAIIYTKKSHHSWVDSKLKDLIKAPGFGRKTPFLAQAVWVAADGKNIQRRHGDSELLMIENETIQPEKLKPFLSKINA